MKALLIVVATGLVMVLGIVFGVWMVRSALVDRLLRPSLDAAQVMPPFVYLVPLFSAILAVLLIHEPFAPYHAVALALVIGGIWLAQRTG